MPSHRKIIHLDLDAFYCAVEEQLNPELRGKAFVVGGAPEKRGVVASCSYPARQFGVRSAMPVAQALRLFPGLLVISPHFPQYRRASRRVMARLHAVTDQVEQLSIDEAFLDVTGLDEETKAIARRLQTEIREDLGLPSSIGVATNKLVAKIATDVGKSRHRDAGAPHALTVVPPGEEAAFLAPLGVRNLWGVGPKTADQLQKTFGVTTIGDLAALPPEKLEKAFGKNGLAMGQHARGIDHRPIVTERRAKSISQETTFATDLREGEKLRAVLQEQAHHIANELQKAQVKAHTIKIKLRWSDFTTITRQITTDIPTDDAGEIERIAARLLKRAWQRDRPVRLLGVGVSGLEEEVQQLRLWN